ADYLTLADDFSKGGSQARAAATSQSHRRARTSRAAEFCAQQPDQEPTHTCTDSRMPAGSYSTMYPATALAATVSGEAKYIWPGPLRPGKLRFWALITTWSGRVETPGPALMQAPQLGSMTMAPASRKTSR